ncbi:peptidoglycan DD-metalloendopeptidase family protein [Oceanobacter sp. 5_MG-2023]|uniref:peptidoglycan DD-metalloendopeptidase family protein n=1 Tax=Oceanobacter sp. 5_MG-2023 TaxID=3062645 RepID=UPI0026E23ADD|nr:peptidoglycan DD-metalloendopeptidase family protein [Oceanobacter sp. 5_MG-2023]MDO6680975.1 peptidoglycan DD-metalloendopeptidase family protein [Oceanobacter sp. 5_MG-2023]
MAEPSRFQYFPATHLAGVIIASILILLILLWPSGNARQVTSLKVALPEATIQAAEPEVKWEQDKVKSGDSLSTLFSRNNLSAADVVTIASKVPKEAIQLYPGQEVRWERNWDGRVKALEIPLSPLARHRIDRADDGAVNYQLIERDAEYIPHFASATINNSLFLDGERAGVPEKILIELAGIFGWDIDFALDIRTGDHFSLIYEDVFLDGKQIGNGDILAARFVNQGREITAIRYEDKDGNANYYTPEGLSMRKEFLRNPIDFARISSRFNLGRRHPVLNTIRAHKGTDYAAATGTPIKAAGDGKIIFAGRKGGYGNVVILQHGTRYQTLYAHMNSFHRSVRRGRSVKQGQIIGYVGSTGLATGPHLHYEFRVDGVHRDSLRVKLPKAQSIAAADKPAFLKKAHAMLTWLDGYRVSMIQ